MAENVGLGTAYADSVLTEAARKAAYTEAYSGTTTFLKEKGFTLEKTNPNGNCLFEAVGKAVGKTEKTVRAEVVAQLITKCGESKDFEGSVSAELVTILPKILPTRTDITGLDICKTYTDYISKNSSYGGALEIFTMEELYKRPIHIYLKQVLAPSVENVYSKQIREQAKVATGAPINLIYFPSLEHYDLLVPTASEKAIMRTLYDVIAPKVGLSGADAVVAKVNEIIPRICTPGTDDEGACTLKDAYGKDPTVMLDTALDELDEKNIILLARAFNRKIYVFMQEAGIINMLGGEPLVTYYDRAELTGDPIYIQFTGNSHLILEDKTGQRVLKEFSKSVGVLYEAVSRAVGENETAADVLKKTEKITLTFPGYEGGGSRRYGTIQEYLGETDDGHLNSLIRPTDGILLWVLSKTYKHPIYVIMSVKGKYKTVGDIEKLKKDYNSAADISGEPLYFTLFGTGAQPVTQETFKSLIGGGIAAKADGAGSADDEYAAVAASLLLESVAALIVEKRIVTGVAIDRKVAAATLAEATATPEEAAATPAEAAAAAKTIAGMAGSFIAAPFKAVADAGRSALGALGARLSTTKAPTAVAVAAAPRTPFVLPAPLATYPEAVSKQLAALAERRRAQPPPAIDPDSAAIAAAALTEKTAVTPGTAVSLPASSTKDDVVSTYIVWNDHVLIHQRGPMIVFARTISVPGGAVAAGETYTAAALRELKEEAQLVATPALDVSGLTAFRTLKVPVAGGDKNVIAFVARVAAKPVVGGPEATFADEVLNPLDATVLTLSSDKDGNAGHPAYRWVHRETLQGWLATEGNARYKNDLFATTLAALNKWLGPSKVKAAPVPPAAAVDAPASLTVEGQIPAWVPSTLFSVEDLDAAKADKCSKTSFPTNDCLAAEVHRDIDTADTYKSNYRLTKRSDRMLQRYRDLKKEEEALLSSPDQSQKTKNKLEKVQRHLEADFYDEQVLVRVHDPKTQTSEVKKFSVPNPYRALAYRDQDPNFRPNFANPTGTGKSVYDPDGKMFAANAAVLKEIAPAEMIADHDMAVALLESLWYCGRNPTVSNDPRCFPLRLMGELREWDANKRQMRGAAAAKAILDRQEWPNMKSWLAGLLAYTKGNTVYPWIPPPGEPKKVVAAPAVAAAPAAPAAAAAVLASTIAIAKPGLASPAPAAAAGGPPARPTLPALLGIPIVPLTRGAALIPLIPRPLRLG